MRIRDLAITAAVVVGLSAPALAQTNQPAPATAIPPAGGSSSDAGHWLASGFLGTNFGSGANSDRANFFGLEDFSNSSTSATFGGQIAYLGGGILGGEFLAEFSPRSGNFNDILFERSPNVNSYMFNAIANAPFGAVHSFDPYISGGIGWVGMHADIFTSDPTKVNDVSLLSTESVSAHRFGWDLGGGVMAWSEKAWGFRGDVRYYRTTSSSTDVFDINDIGTGDAFAKAELSGIHFWKANAGLSFRW
jgi:hypothetical protein